MRSLTLKRLLTVGLAVLLAVSAVGADDIKVPSDAEAVVVFNVKSLLNSKLAKDYNLVTLAKDAIPEDAKTHLAALGLDPFKDLDSVVITGHGDPSKSGKFLVLLNGTFDAKKLTAAAEKQPNVTVHKVAGQAVLEVPGQDGMPVYGAVAANQVVLSNDKDLTANVAGGKGLGKPNKALAEALKKLTGKETLALTVVITDEIKKMVPSNDQTKPLLKAVNAVTGGVTVADNVELIVRGHAADEDGANTIKNALAVIKFGATLTLGKQKGLPAATKTLVEAIKVDSDKDSAWMSLKITPELIKDLQKGEDKDKEKDKDK